MWNGVIETMKSYRAEEGQRGDGRWPPQARNGFRGKWVEVQWRPPENLQDSKVGVGTRGVVVWVRVEWRRQYRRHLRSEATKVESMRGQGAGWRPATPQVNISDVNGNTADKRDHLSSVIGALLDAVKNAIKALADMVWEWIKSKAETLLNKVIKPVLQQVLSPFYDLIYYLSNNLAYENGEFVFSGNRNSIPLCTIIWNFLAIPILLLSIIYYVLCALEKTADFLSGGSLTVLAKIGGFAVSYLALLILVTGLTYAISEVTESGLEKAAKWVGISAGVAGAVAALIYYALNWGKYAISGAKSLDSASKVVPAVIWALISFLLTLASIVFEKVMTWWMNVLCDIVAIILYVLAWKDYYTNPDDRTIDIIWAAVPAISLGLIIVAGGALIYSIASHRKDWNTFVDYIIP